MRQWKAEDFDNQPDLIIRYQSHVHVKTMEVFRKCGCDIYEIIHRSSSDTIWNLLSSSSNNQVQLIDRPAKSMILPVLPKDNADLYVLDSEEFRDYVIKSL